VAFFRSLYEKFQFSLGFFGDVLREYIYENTGLKLIALLIAIVLWAAVSKQESVQITLQDVPIDYANLAQGLSISNDDNLKTATVRVRGPKDSLETLRPENLSIRINLNNTKLGERVIPLSHADVVSPVSIEVVDIEPQRTHLTIERIIKRQVPVVPRFNSNLPKDYEITSHHVNPVVITIQGPESRVNAVADAPTETISMAEHRTSFIERPNIDIKDPRIYIVGSPTIEVQVQVGQIRVDRVITSVPVRVQPSTDKVSLNPITVSVEVEGPKSLIEELLPNEISAIINVGDLPDTSVATPNIVLPPAAIGSVVIKKVDPAQVQIKRRR
jgi:hypothetical protein